VEIRGGLRIAAVVADAVLALTALLSFAVGIEAALRWALELGIVASVLLSLLLLALTILGLIRR
jgi:hypothetical protein